MRARASVSAYLRTFETPALEEALGDLLRGPWRRLVLALSVPI